MRFYDTLNLMLYLHKRSCNYTNEVTNRINNYYIRSYETDSLTFSIMFMYFIVILNTCVKAWFEVFLVIKKRTEFIFLNQNRL